MSATPSKGARKLAPLRHEELPVYFTPSIETLTQTMSERPGFLIAWTEVDRYGRTVLHGLHHGEVGKPCADVTIGLRVVAKRRK